MGSDKASGMTGINDNLTMGESGDQRLRLGAIK
jgi:hypothetical protein